MPEMTFDENGLPVWTNTALSADRSGTDPDPLSAAIAAIGQIGNEIPYPTSMPEMGPGAQPIGPPPAETRANALINPETDALEYPPGPQPAPDPGLTNYDPASVMSGPAVEPDPQAVAAAPAQAPSMAASPAVSRPADPVAA